MTDQKYQDECANRDTELERFEEIQFYREQLEISESWLSFYEKKVMEVNLEIIDLRNKIVNLGGKI